tara:strand:- start:1121 stop:1315 length:195 start_codon:yes stop_codon:yes gene_type:complete
MTNQEVIDSTYMPYDKAIDIAFSISKDETDGWTYTAEIDAATGLARICVYDETKTKMGYLRGTK